MNLRTFTHYYFFRISVNSFRIFKGNNRFYVRNLWDTRGFYLVVEKSFKEVSI